MKYSPAAIRKQKAKMLRRGDLCAACGEAFTDYRDAEYSHLSGKGIGGYKRDDSKAVLLHARANREMGSMPFDYYMKNHWKPGHCQ
jgi:hypothetical protein